MFNRSIRRLYDWTLRLSAHRHATLALAGVSFAESSFFPLPPDIVLIPMCVARRDRAFFYAFICTVFSVIGGFAGYAIGYFFFETVGRWILDAYGLSAQFSAFSERYHAWGGWIVFTAGMTPFPYKVITIASGVVQMNLMVFMVASVVGRASRFFLIAALIWRYGAPIQAFIEKHLGLLSIIFTALLIGGFVGIKYLL